MTQFHFNDARLALEIADLPALQGSGKQIAWADSIRLEAVREIVKLFGNARSAAIARNVDVDLDEQARKAGIVFGAMLSRTDAKFWIDNRNIDVRILAQRQA